MKQWNFPTGEHGIIVDDNLTINWDWTQEKDIFKICTHINALATKYPYETINLNAPYLPYSRQDKIFNIGECHAFRLLLNQLSLAANNKLSIVTWAVHNAKAFTSYCRDFCINNSTHVFDISRLITLMFQRSFNHDSNIIFPDKHAEDHFTCLSSINQSYYCSKVRGDNSVITHFDCQEIKDTKIPSLIVDDICDGGATFIKCAEALKSQGVEDIRLFVYHGFFTKGLQPLFDAGIKEIYTTNSVCRLEHENLHIIEDVYNV